MHADRPLPFEKRTVFTAHGVGDLGKVSPDLALRLGVRTGPVRLLNGVQGAKGGFGRAHIESYVSRMRQLEGIGFRNAVSYVYFVVSAYGFAALQADGLIILVRPSGSLFHHVVCQWDGGLSLWSVTTAIPKNTMRHLQCVWIGEQGV